MISPLDATDFAAAEAAAADTVEVLVQKYALTQKILGGVEEESLLELFRALVAMDRSWHDRHIRSTEEMVPGEDSTYESSPALNQEMYDLLESSGVFTSDESEILRIVAPFRIDYLNDVFTGREARHKTAQVLVSQGYSADSVFNLMQKVGALVSVVQTGKHLFVTQGLIQQIIGNNSSFLHGVSEEVKSLKAA